MLATKNHQGGLHDSADESDGKMFETPDSLRCPVKTLEITWNTSTPSSKAFFSDQDRNLANSTQK